MSVRIRRVLPRGTSKQTPALVRAESDSLDTLSDYLFHQKTCRAVQDEELKLEIAHKRVRSFLHHLRLHPVHVEILAQVAS